MLKIPHGMTRAAPRCNRVPACTRVVLRTLWEEDADMAVEVLFDGERSRATLYCNTSGVAFGPVLDVEDADEAHLFLNWLENERKKVEDPREMSVEALRGAFKVFRRRERARK
jgi:hypothetical protein